MLGEAIGGDLKERGGLKPHTDDLLYGACPQALSEIKAVNPHNLSGALKPTQKKPFGRRKSELRCGGGVKERQSFGSRS